MPGSKRKQDEDTWLIFQSKKFKTNQLSERIYESTLAKLRQGARAFFSTQGASETPSWANYPDGSASNQSTASHSNVDMRNIHLTEGQGQDTRPSNPAGHEGIPVCTDCQWNGSSRLKTYFEKCNFCDRPACHVNQCDSCGDQFCQNCYIRRYDDPSADKFLKGDHSGLSGPHSIIIFKSGCRQSLGRTLVFQLLERKMKSKGGERWVTGKKS
ncbi:unnamed protein product [Allacma fusca]|uniref:Uncharacterized protein n=1 Tax=Allacma fusca TaxID=39272 RepID=A0A8J2J7Y6_9HEXA|nr:unnamed protein product [Allacma fusca]